MTSTLRLQRQHRRRAAWLRVAILLVLVLVVAAVSLMVGRTFYGPSTIIQVALGEHVPGASYTVGLLRGPRVALALCAGMAFGAAGSVFQLLLRNQLASPDIIGISSGASAVGVFAIIVFRWGQTSVSLAAVAGGIATAVLIYLLSLRDGFRGTRLILVGIGISSILHAVVTWTLSIADAWDLPTATRWLTGSLNDATWERVVPVAIVVLVLLPLLSVANHQLSALRLGEDIARIVGVPTTVTRVVIIIAAVVLIAVATASCGPLAFVAFMSGPIAIRWAGSSANLVLSSALVGALLVLLADLVAQNFLGVRYPAGVITGTLGAPFLLYLLVRSHRSGGAS